MEKNIISYFVWLTIVVVGAVFFFWFFGLKPTAAPASVPKAAQEAQGGLSSGSDVRADDALSAASSSDRTVSNTAAHYRIAVPANWYVENNGKTGITLYPDYDPTAPSCKVEISALPNKSNLMLGDWLEAYLHQDPTADIADAGQVATRVSGRDAIIWSGALNGISSTLAYATGDGLVYEFAPSKIGAGDCPEALQVVLKNFIVTTP